MLLAHSVGLALLVVLDTLSPAERLAFVLHDIFAVPFDEVAPIVCSVYAESRSTPSGPGAARGRPLAQGDRQDPGRHPGRRRPARPGRGRRAASRRTRRRRLLDQRGVEHRPGDGDHPGWPLDEDEAGGGAGLASVLVARRHRHGKVSVCGYLADVYCLGVKNAMGPQVMDEHLLSRHVREYFSGHAGTPLEAPIELAREVVYGSVEYARRLGFEPHEDFAAAAGHLGPWTGPSAITFGNEGKPFYISGP